MKLRAAFIALALFSTEASADFKLIGESTDGIKYFMDLSSRQQQGKYILIWSRFDIPKALLVHGNSFNSAKMLDIYDCSGFRYGTKSFVYYSGKSGTGKVVRSVSSELHEVNFRDVAPDTMAEQQFKFACGK